MKKFKITSSELRLLLIVLAIAILALSWFLGFRNMTNYASRVNEQNAVDEATVTQLKLMEQNRSQVEQETAEAYQKIDDIIAKYPSALTQEKAISIVQDMEEKTGVHISAAGFLMDDLIGEVSGTSIATGEADESAVADMPTADSNIGYYAVLTMNYQATYDGFKEMLDYVAALPDRANMPNVSAEYDEETGGLVGSISLYMYYLTNTDREYEAPEITGVNKGVFDIFGTGSTGGLDLTQNEDTNTDADTNEDVDAESDDDADSNADDANGNDDNASDDSADADEENE